MTTNKTKVAIWAIFFMVLGLCAMIVYFANRNRSSNTLSTSELKKRIESYENQNKVLIDAVHDLNEIVEREKEKDSSLRILAERATETLPEINNRISAINKNYEKEISSARNYDISDAERYFAREAARVRQNKTE